MSAYGTRRGLARRLVASGAGLMFGVGMLALTAPPAGATVAAPTCTFSGTTVAVNAVDAEEYSIYLFASGSDVTVKYLASQVDVYDGTGANLLTCAGGDGADPAVTVTVATADAGSYTDVYIVGVGAAAWSSKNISVADPNTISNSAVWVVGTAGDDSINAAYLGFTLTLTNISNLGMQGLAGNDTLTLGTPGPASAVADRVARGGEGADILNGSALADFLYGDAGNDNAYAGDGNDEIDGGAGEDVLNGDAGNDGLHGGGDNDTLYGDAGEDQLFGEGGGDYMSGGADVDDVRYDDGHHACAVTVTIDGNSGDGCAAEADNVGLDVENLQGGSEQDTFTGNGSSNELVGGGGNDTLNGGEGDDTLNGEDGDDILNGDPGFDFLDGEAGSDTLNGGVDSDSLFGGDDNDTLNGGADGDSLYGNDGIDTLHGDAGADELRGGNGNDSVYGDAGNGDRLYAVTDDGNDYLSGGDGINDLVSYAARVCDVTADADGGTNDDGCSGEADTISVDIEDLFGGSGNDTLTGNTSDNLLYGGLGDDTLIGGDGNDTLRGYSGNDTLSGEGGADTADYSLDTSGITINLQRLSYRGAAAGDTLTSIENIIGTQLKDTITGDLNPNVLSGGPGNDSLKGGDGDDTLTGNDGTDVAVGGANTTTTPGDTCDAERERTCET